MYEIEIGIGNETLQVSFQNVNEKKTLHFFALLAVLY